ncbi:RND family efflux transporter MFP subunit [Alicycliphilus sp. B1]|nr:RND family efflux transporter MFP subunit [Alicycliphilus sp. B1]
MQSLKPFTPLIAAAVLAAGGTLLARAAQEAPAPGPAPGADRGGGRSPSASPCTGALAANGNVAAWQEASIGAEVSGLRLAEVRVNVGDVVRAGQVLAVFADDTVRADAAQARAGLLEAARRRRRGAGQRRPRGGPLRHGRHEPAADPAVRHGRADGAGARGGGAGGARRAGAAPEAHARARAQTPA